MPDELLASMEDQIVERYMSRLDSLLRHDERIDKTSTVYVTEAMNRAKESYERLYKK